MHRNPLTRSLRLSPFAASAGRLPCFIFFRFSLAARSPMVRVDRRFFCILVVLLQASAAFSLWGTPQQEAPRQGVVVPLDRAVVGVCARALRPYASGIARSGPSATIFQAAVLFDALGSSGLRFTRPAADGKGGPLLASDGVRLFRNPGETLAAGGGNDEDLAVLYTSALLSAGIRAAFVVSSGPLLAAFDTGLDAHIYRPLFPNDDQFFVKEGTVWLTIDPTLMGSSFTEAWAATAALLKRLLIEARRGDLPAQTNGANGNHNVTLDTELLKGHFDFDRRYLVQLFAKLGRDQEGRKLAPAVFLRMATLEVDLGHFEAAAAHLDSALALGGDPLAVLFHRANLFHRQGRYRKMAQVGGKLMSLDPGNPRGYLVAAYAASQLGETERARILYRKAKALSATTRNRP